MRRATIAGIGMALAAANGCGLRSGEIAFIERGDVSLAVPAARADAGAVHGEAHERVATTADAINGWLGALIDESALIVAEAADHRETRREGRFALYGPFDDEGGRDIAWLAKLDADDRAATFEIWVGRRGAGEGELALALAGELHTMNERREGAIAIDFDVIDQLPDLRPEQGARFAGAVSVAFTRHQSDGAAHAAIEFVDFAREDAAGTTWRADDTFLYEQDPAGGGAFHLVLESAIDVPILADLGVSDVDRLELDARWDASAAGRARARVRAAANPDSVLPHGDLFLHECFDAVGGLTWRDLNEPYAAERPSYALGDAATCVFLDTDLDVP